MKILKYQKYNWIDKKRIDNGFLDCKREKPNHFMILNNKNVIKINEIPLYKLHNNVYIYSYYFDESVSYQSQKDYIKTLKSITIDKKEIIKYIQEVVYTLTDVVNLARYDYKLSFDTKSNINRCISRLIYNHGKTPTIYSKEVNKSNELVLNKISNCKNIFVLDDFELRFSDVIETMKKILTINPDITFTIFSILCKNKYDNIIDM